MRLNLKKAFCLAKETKHKSVYTIWLHFGEV